MDKEKLIAICWEEAKGQCWRCEQFGEPTQKDELGVFWHRVNYGLSRKDQWCARSECNASAINRIIEAIRDST